MTTHFLRKLKPIVTPAWRIFAVFSRWVRLVSEAVRVRTTPWAFELKIGAVVAVIVALRPFIEKGWVRFCVGFGSIVHAVITTSLFQHEQAFQYMQIFWDYGFTDDFGGHVRLTIEACSIAIAVAVPCGIILSRIRWLQLPTFIGLDIIYTIPSLVAFAVLLPFTHLTDTTVVVPLVLYAQFILVRNVSAGIQGVPAATKEAARGMGMNKGQILLRIELPLAMPVIMAGIRIAVVTMIATITLTGLFGYQCLGFLFNDATQNGGVNAIKEIRAGAIAVTFLALSADLLFRGVEYFVPANRVARAGRRRWLSGRRR